MLWACRAGGELGRAWHASGARALKVNGMRDLLAGVEALEASGVAQQGQIVGHAVSAGASSLLNDCSAF